MEAWPVSDDIRVGTNANLTVAEAACADYGGLILTDPDTDDEDERTNRSLAAFAREGENR